MKKNAGTLVKKIPANIKMCTVIAAVKDTNPDQYRAGAEQVNIEANRLTQLVLDLENTITTRIKRIPDAYQSDEKLNTAKKLLSQLQILIVNMRRAVGKLT